jgi:hypothetical protein
LSALSEEELHLVARWERLYSYQFYLWKKEYQLRKNWLIYRKRSCGVCGGKTRSEKTGRFDRRSFYCPNCQKLRKRPLAGRRARADIATKLQDISRQLRQTGRKVAMSGAPAGVEGDH